MITLSKPLTFFSMCFKNGIALLSWVFTLLFASAEGNHILLFPVLIMYCVIHSGYRFLISCTHTYSYAYIRVFVMTQQLHPQYKSACTLTLLTSVCFLNLVISVLWKPSLHFSPPDQQHVSSIHRPVFLVGLRNTSRGHVCLHFLVPFPIIL